MEKSISQIIYTQYTARLFIWSLVLHTKCALVAGIHSCTSMYLCTPFFLILVGGGCCCCCYVVLQFNFCVRFFTESFKMPLYSVHIHTCACTYILFAVLVKTICKRLPNFKHKHGAHFTLLCQYVLSLSIWKISNVRVYILCSVRNTAMKQSDTVQVLSKCS